MRIAILGAGNVGGALSKASVAAGHDVVISADRPEHAEQAAQAADGLRMARALEEMAFLNISLNAANGWPWQSAWKLVGPTGEG